MGGDALTTGFRRAPALAALAILLSPAIAFSAVPLVRLLASAAVEGASARAYFSGRSLETLANTVVLAAATAAVASVLGCVTGLVLGIAEWRGRGFFRLLLLVPLAIPPYLHGIGWTQFLRPNGPVARAIADIFGCAPTLPSASIQSLPGAVAILSLAYFPLVALFTEKALTLAPRSLPEAAQVFGASRWQLFRHVYWPCVRSSVLSGAAIVALLTASEMGVPALLKVRVFSFEILTQLAAFNDVAGAAMLTAPLLALGFIALRLAPFLVNIDVPDDSADGFLPFPAVSAAAWWRRAAFMTALAFVACVLPLGTIVAGAFDREAWGAMVPVAARPAMQSLSYAGIAAIAATSIALGLGAAMRSAGHRTTSAIQSILLIGFSVPGAMLGLALISLYGGSEWIGGSLLATAALIVRFQIAAYYAIAASMRQVPPSLLEAAALDGAGPWRRFISVELPLIRVPIVMTISCVFILGQADMGSVILLYPPGGETLMLALYSIEANSPRSYVAVLTLLSAALATFPVLLSGLAVKTMRQWHARQPTAGTGGSP